jgi:DNA-binding NarL/FixJ family response regulator
MSGLRLLVVDHQPLILSGIRGSLGAVDDMEIVGEATSAKQLLPLVSRTSPDVVLLDLDTPGHDALAVLEQLRLEYPQVTVLAMSDQDDAAQIMRALEVGASGYILKSIDPADLAAAIRQSVTRTFVCLGAMELRMTSTATEAEDALSIRETEVLQKIAVGLSNRAIANDLWLSEQTVKFHLRNIYRKLGVSNRTEAARHAFHRGLAEVTA